MSVKATEWAWAIDLKGGVARHVLLCLAYHHNGKTNSCFPKISTIMRETGWGETAVSKALAVLEDAGYIAINRSKKNGLQMPNQYVLALDGVVFSAPVSQGRSAPVSRGKTAPASRGHITGIRLTGKEEQARAKKNGEYGEVVDLQDFRSAK